MSVIAFQTALDSGLGGQGAVAVGRGLLPHLSVFRIDFPAEAYM